MKKLLITTMAAVSVGLCAKAADAGFISGTSFETLPEKSYLATDGEATLCKWFGEAGSVLSDDYSNDPELRSRYWMTEATDAQLVVSNLSMFAGGYLPNADRPQQWSGGDNTKALYIDTDKPLMRYVHPSTDGNTAVGADLDQDIFFDSVVQFTATDVAAEPDSADKLRVWLYTSPDDVATTPGLFEETTPKTCLVVTAGSYDGADGLMGNLTHKHYEITGIDVQPDTWHRLTIKAIADINASETFNTPGFEIWVDGIPVTYDKKTQFPSLQRAVANETLQCVAFDGKGAVDDIVFTTTDPFEAPSYEVTVKMSDTDQVTSGKYKAYSINGGRDFVELAETVVGAGVKLTIPTTAETILFKIDVADGYKIDGVETSTGDVTDEGFYWVKPVALADIVENGVGEISLAIVLDDGGEDPVTTYSVNVSVKDSEATVSGFSATYAEGATVSFTVAAASGYTIQNVAVAGATTTPVLTLNGNTYTFTMPAEAVTITVTTKAIEEEVTYPSVGGVETPEYSDNAKYAIDAAFPDNSYPTDGLTVKVNGEVLAGAKAVEMLNEAVEMFTLADDAKFFNEDGVMEISFKATSADPETIAYEATVGKVTATVNETSYEVVPKYIDIATNTELTAKPEGTVTFRLVIQKK